MWGDVAGAAALNHPSTPDDQSRTRTPSSSKCSASLVHISGPAHIPLSDTRWQELFLSYEVLVHLDRGHSYSNNGNQDDNSNGNNNGNDRVGNSKSNSMAMALIAQVCRNMEKNTRLSSNMAGFSWHLSSMIHELIRSCDNIVSAAKATSKNVNMNMNMNGVNANANASSSSGDSSLESTSTRPTNNTKTNSNSNSNGNTNANTTSMKIALVGKGRVVCGALNLFRILIHEIISESCREGTDMEEVFLFQSREQQQGNMQMNMHMQMQMPGQNTDAAPELRQDGNMNMAPSLINSLLSFLSLTNDSKEMAKLIYSTAELYDATVFCLDLVMVLFSPQLYQPMLSSFQQREQHQHQQDGSAHRTRNYFLDLVMEETWRRRQQLELEQEQSQYEQQTQKRKSSSRRKQQKKQQQQRLHNVTSKTILSTCLKWMIARPSPPQRSIAHHLQTMAQLIANEVKNEKTGADGMYENHAIVMANSPLHVLKKMKHAEDDDEYGEGGVDVGVGVNGDSGGGGGGGSHQHNGGANAGGVHANKNGMYGYGHGYGYNAPRLILDATNKVIHVSSSLLLLPIRLMVLALKALGNNSKSLIGGGKGGGDADSKLAQLTALYGNHHVGGGSSSASFASPTNDVLWISDSPIADLGSSLFLILSNNNRGGYRSGSGSGSAIQADGGDVHVDAFESSAMHAFRIDLESLDDNRWDGYSNGSIEGFLGGGGESDVFDSISLSESHELRGSMSSMSPPKHIRDPHRESDHLTTNFEHLFDSFGGTLHNEIGSLVLYTLIQSSPRFAKSLAVRSDLDKLVIPLLRTLYFSSSITHHIAGRTSTASTSTDANAVNVSEHPFRSASQLYVILILLLIFSQDASFGPDSFRRSNIPNIPWYKERQLKDISLGSLLVLSLLRCVTYNLNRMQDPFLLSNCCAVMLNLSPNIANLHPYAAMRLVSVTIATMKRYTVLVMKNGGKPAQEGDVCSLIGMYAEACRILLQVVKHAVRRKVVDQNLHLVYALIYHQRDLNTILKAKSSPFKPVDTEKIRAVMKEANTMIQEASARNAQQSMEILQKNVHVLKGLKVGSAQRGRIGSESSVDSTMSDSTMNGMEDFKFTYEEEADPETFFVPYVWDVIVSTVTSNSLEWDRMNIKVFAIMHHANDGDVSGTDVDNVDGVGSGEYAKDAGDVV